jgi:tetratricopeptide (TPR) repeat protein
MSRAADAANLRRQLARDPGDRVAWHNLAAAEGDLGRVAEAEAAARRALALGITAPETRLVLARALQGQRRLDEAERAFDEAIALRPAYFDAHRDLAQLVWMRTGRADAALERVERALCRAPRDAGLYRVKALVLEFAGDNTAARDAAEAGLAAAPADAALLQHLSHLCVETADPERAVTLARRAAAQVPADVDARACLCEALLAAGRADEAEPVAAALLQAAPRNQYVLALLATAWRLLGDARADALFDYDTLVGAQRLDTPPGFASLEDFLAELAADLESLHAFSAHPLQQSLRGGSQLTLQAAELERPLVSALLRCLFAGVHRHIARLGTGTDPLRSRNTGRALFTGAWSVRLRSGGSHVDHVHPHGWLSSACYIALPPTLGAGTGAQCDRAGWLRLGRPSFPTRPPLAAQRFVKPEAGSLVLFPAYLWHGVEPFEGDHPRLSVAFDAVPA